MNPQPSQSQDSLSDQSQFPQCNLIVFSSTCVTTHLSRINKYIWRQHKNTNRTEDSGAPGESGTVILPTSVASSDDEIIPILMASSTS